MNDGEFLYFVGRHRLVLLAELANLQNRRISKLEMKRTNWKDWRIELDLADKKRIKEIMSELGVDELSDDVLCSHVYTQDKKKG